MVVNAKAYIRRTPIRVFLQQEKSLPSRTAFSSPLLKPFAATEATHFSFANLNECYHTCLLPVLCTKSKALLSLPRWSSPSPKKNTTGDVPLTKYSYHIFSVAPRLHRSDSHKSNTHRSIKCIFLSYPEPGISVDQLVSMD